MPMNTALNDTVITIPDQKPCWFQDMPKFHPLSWLYWLELEVQNWGSTMGVFFDEIWQHPALAAYVALHIVIPFLVTRRTMMFAENWREAYFVKKGYESFANDPLKHIVDTTAGMVLSSAIRIGINQLKNSADHSEMTNIGQVIGIDFEKTKSLVDEAYSTGIKVAFFEQTLEETAKAGGIAWAMTGALFLANQYAPVIKSVIMGAVFLVFVEMVYRKMYAKKHPRTAVR
jgi:hypothetical protein